MAYNFRQIEKYIHIPEDCNRLFIYKYTLYTFIYIHTYIYIYIYILHYICICIYIFFYIYIYIYIFIYTSVVKPVHIFMARGRVSKSCLKTELCLHSYVHFSWVPIYNSVFTTNTVLAIRRTWLLWSSPLSCSVALMSP